jgi:transformation/transcription domain-associated protein
MRQAAQTCVGLLVSLSGRPAVDLLLPHRDRMLVGIYTKPSEFFLSEKNRDDRSHPILCKLGPPFNSYMKHWQWEMLTMRFYWVEQRLDKVLSRLSNSVSPALNYSQHRRLTNFFKPGKGTFSAQCNHIFLIHLLSSVYFKLLYSSSPEVKDVAHKGLRMVLTH